MYDYIKGKLVEKTPTYIIVETGGIGYHINVSVNSSSGFNDEAVKVFTYVQYREDAQTIYGFSSKSEREVFKKLISVSGVGASTAQLILSGMTSNEVVHAIISEDIAKFKAIKGIGLKSAQRIIVDLKDKVSSEGIDENFSVSANNTNRSEALSALLALGFVKLSAGKALDKVLKNDASASTEVLVKEALKFL